MKFHVKNTSSKGLGIYASEKISANTVLTEMKYIRELTEETPLSEDEKHLQDHIHYFPDGRTFIVDEPICYFNHCCNPNAFVYSANKKYFIIAKKDIEKDEEITIDYEILTTGYDVSWECKCGATNCRGMHKWDIFSLPDTKILESLPFLDPWFAQVHSTKIQEVLERNL